MVTEAKKQMVQELTDKFSEVKSAVLTDFRGLDVQKMTELRDELRDEDVEYKVAKNTLTRFALKNCGFDEMDKYLDGPTGIAFSYEDAVAAARVLSDFMKENEELEVKGGLVEGDVVGPDQIMALAKIPPRDVLLAQVSRGFQSPLYGLASVLSGVMRNLVYVLNAVKEEKA